MPTSVIGRFLALSVFWLLCLLLPWYFVAPWLAKPTIDLAGALMDFLFHWVDSVQRDGVSGTLVTHIELMIPQNGKYLAAVIAPEASYLTYGYGTVLLWALLLASRPPRWLIKGLAGSVALIPFQVWGLCFQWLRDVGIHGGATAADYLRFPQWGLEGVALGYQFGFLVLTPLAPVVLWLAFDRRFMVTLWLEASLAGTAERRDNAAL